MHPDPWRISQHRSSSMKSHHETWSKRKARYVQFFATWGPSLTLNEESSNSTASVGRTRRSSSRLSLIAWIVMPTFLLKLHDWKVSYGKLMDNTLK
jgi:hypothetical protein